MEEKEYAGFWIRFGAALIDSVIMLIIIAIPLTAIYGEGYWTSEQSVMGFWDVIFNYILPSAATIWLWLKYMATPGKMALKLIVVDATTGNKLTTGQAIGRYFAYFVAMLPLGLGFIWVGIDKKKQGWHDKLAGTVVIRNTGKEPVQFKANA
jgi:uncharacterized RDD family membrane protein YckC